MHKKGLLGATWLNIYHVYESICGSGYCLPLRNVIRFASLHQVNWCYFSFVHFGQWNMLKTFHVLERWLAQNIWRLLNRLNLFLWFFKILWRWLSKGMLTLLLLFLFPHHTWFNLILWHWFNSFFIEIYSRRRIKTRWLNAKAAWMRLAENHFGGLTKLSNLRLKGHPLHRILQCF